MLMMGCLGLRAVDDDGARGRDGDGQDDGRHHQHVHRRQGRELVLHGNKECTYQDQVDGSCALASLPVHLPSSSAPFI
jgi:hypothetical protein